ncbi:sigma-54-dependent transcriptional regulator [Geobacter argillaceus]|uniref:Two-component system C4-dicarboxylate transport response regulator DctD n=1 Tax=Geobacter argillaceus TaxID=345631 RepID=A0A562VKM4_9BACT|nr:sigma-54 dependent transcriptional regulator [Geobacter argillaceus]TWJ18362.1 two-component system C4-dicarboxylate transport response regulator DctD [Geobacter argillaceus]
MTRHNSPDNLLVYLVEDDEAVLHGCQQAIHLADLSVRAFRNAESALAALEDDPPAVVVSDVRLQKMSGLELLDELQKRDRDLPVILITGHGDVSMAVQAMRANAYDFIEKPFHSERLVDVIRRGLEKRRLLLEIRRLHEQLVDVGAMPLIGQSEAMLKVRRSIAALAPTDVDVLILGETGTGKEVVAHALHAQSGRKGPFVALNCGALPETIFESEMFGHEAGAFTGADRRRIGKIEYANAGTLFLDEIESMPLALQVKLLRVLQERRIERLGSNSSIPVDCRLVAATKTNMKQLSDKGAFRADLYYRLNVVTIELPPLRQRPGDIAPLMAYFLSQAASRFNREAPAWNGQDLIRWQQHDWPGNVRELKAVAERLCLGVGDGLEPGRTTAASLAAQVDTYERGLIREALRSVKGVVADAAHLLQIPKKTLYDKLNRYGLEPEHFR